LFATAANGAARNDVGQIDDGQIDSGQIDSGATWLTSWLGSGPLFRDRELLMLNNYVIAGGTKGIGLALVNRLRSHATRIDVYSRTLDQLQVDDVIHHHPCDFSREDVELSDLPRSHSRSRLLPGVHQFAIIQESEDAGLHR
jgi:hypothetical protein